LYVPSLIAAAGVADGHAVLDVAAGTGEATVGLTARVGAAGRVLAVDVSQGMLALAARKVAGRPVRFALMDGQSLAVRAASFDAVVCQLGLMFFAEPLRGLQECWRVLRPRRRMALQVWSRPERITFYGPLAEAVSRELPEHRDSIYLPSALADADRVQALLAGAGFSEVTVTPERRTVTFESFDDYWEAVEAGGSRIGQFYLGLPPGRRAAVREEVERRMASWRSGQRLTLEAEALIAQGTKREPGEGR
jgi:SAM-dependent methyltransferase